MYTEFKLNNSTSFALQYRTTHNSNCNVDGHLLDRQKERARARSRTRCISKEWAILYFEPDGFGYFVTITTNEKKITKKEKKNSIRLGSISKYSIAASFEQETWK